MPEGVITGGWGYVFAAYALTVVGLSLYTWRLRRLRLRRREEVSDGR